MSRLNPQREPTIRNLTQSHTPPRQTLQPLTIKTEIDDPSASVKSSSLAELVIASAKASKRMQKEDLELKSSGQMNKKARSGIYTDGNMKDGENIVVGLPPQSPSSKGKERDKKDINQEKKRANDILARRLREDQQQDEEFNTIFSTDLFGSSYGSFGGTSGLSSGNHSAEHSFHQDHNSDDAYVNKPRLRASNTVMSILLDSRTGVLSKTNSDRKAKIALKTAQRRRRKKRHAKNESMRRRRSRYLEKLEALNRQLAINVDRAFRRSTGEIQDGEDEDEDEEDDNTTALNDKDDDDDDIGFSDDDDDDDDDHSNSEPGEEASTTSSNGEKQKKKRRRKRNKTRAKPDIVAIAARIAQKLNDMHTEADSDSENEMNISDQLSNSLSNQSSNSSFHGSNNTTSNTSISSFNSNVGNNTSVNNTVNNMISNNSSNSSLPSTLPLSNNNSFSSNSNLTTTTTSSSSIQPQGPQMRVVDGRLVIDEESLLITNVDDEFIPKEYINEVYRSNDYKQCLGKRATSSKWTGEEIRTFYRLLGQYGLDFQFISKYFPTKTRSQIKARYKKEERERPVMLDLALKNKLDIDENAFVDAVTIYREVNPHDVVQLENLGGLPSNDATLLGDGNEVSGNGVISNEDEVMNTDNSMSGSGGGGGGNGGGDSNNNNSDNNNTNTTRVEGYEQKYTPSQFDDDDDIFSTDITLIDSKLKQSNSQQYTKPMNLSDTSSSSSTTTTTATTSTTSTTSTNANANVLEETKPIDDIRIKNDPSITIPTTTTTDTPRRTSTRLTSSRAMKKEFYNL